MHRRRLLSVLALGSAGLAGCAAPTGSSTTTPGSMTNGSPGGSTAEESDPTGTERGDGPIVDVGIETSRYFLYADELIPDERVIDPDDIVSAAELDPSFRDVLETAREVGYEVDQVSESVLESVDRFRDHGIGYRFQPYVELTGTPISFDPTVPTFRARLASGDADEADPGRTVRHDDIDSFADPVRELVRTMGAFSAQAPRDEYRISVLPAGVEKFLDEYDYIEDSVGTSRIETERIDPGPPYAISVRELTEEDLWGHPIVAWESLSEPVRRLLTRTIDSDRRAPALPPEWSEYRTDDVPAAFWERLQGEEGVSDRPYVKFEGRMYSVRAQETRQGRLPVELTASTAADVDEPAIVVRLSPSTSGDHPPLDDGLELEARGAVPSVLWLQTPTGRRLLPSDAYESVSWEPAEEGSVDRRIRNIDRASVSGDDALSTAYRIPDAVPAGTYRSWGRFTVSWTNADTGQEYPQMEYPFAVRIGVRR
ncbi:hypothetical protein [Halobellus ordinarius]|uniref:hypothetical protein n=1 Tax=Halobellus ordinarius TaxID=3075120 RepID=UPI00287FF96B|nr:hypothetical protein [Halobellus sp. ZY16]